MAISTGKLVTLSVLAGGTVGALAGKAFDEDAKGSSVPYWAAGTAAGLGAFAYAATGLSGWMTGGWVGGGPSSSAKGLLIGSLAALGAVAGIRALTD